MCPTRMVNGYLIRDEQDNLRDLTPGVAFAANIAGVLSDVYTYQVPAGQTRVILPGHAIMALLQDVIPAALADADYIQIEKRSPSGGVSEVIWNGDYVSITEFQDNQLKGRCPRQVVLDPNDLLVVQVNSAAQVVIQANSHWTIESRLIEKIRL